MKAKDSGGIMRMCIIIITYAVLLVMFLVKFDTVMSVFGRLIKIISPFIYGLVFAYIVNMPMSFIEENLLDKNRKYKIKNNRIKRMIALFAALFLVIAIITSIISILIPQLSESVLLLIDNFDDYPFNERVLSLKAKLIQTIESLGAEAVEVALPTSRVVMPNVLNHEFKNGINRYLATVQGRTAMRSLEDIIQFNKDHATLCLRYGQDLLTQSEAFSGQLKEADYIRQRMQATKNTRAAIDGLLKENNLDCLASLLVTGYAPVSGYPCLAIPADRIDEDQPDPVSCVFIGTAYSESTLIHAAYAVEKKMNLQCCPSWIKK